MTLLAITLGAAVGAALRYLVDVMMRGWLGPAFPWGTLTVNIAGSLLLGIAAGLSLPDSAPHLLGTGFCGALTTYSTFGYETVALLRRGAHPLALLNLLATAVAGLTAAYAGLALATALT